VVSDIRGRANQLASPGVLLCSSITSLKFTSKLDKMIAYIRQLTSKRVIAEIKVSFLFLFGSSNFL